MTELEIRCTDRHALNRYLDLRDILMRCINPLVLEKCSFDFCFLGGGPTHDDFLKAFSTHLAYPNLKQLNIHFFDNGLFLVIVFIRNGIAGKLDWGDYPVITLKRYLYGMALTSRLETVRLFHLDNDMFQALFSMLDRISRLEPIGKEEIERENMAVPSLGFYPLSRKVSYSFEKGEDTTDWTVSFGPEVP